MVASRERADISRPECVILVDEADRCLGFAEKLTAHIEGRLHRAFSVFVFNSRGALLLQRRAATKYHSPGLWSNTCCSHPRPGERVAAAARRRLMEEMGFRCPLAHEFSFVYDARLDNGLIEHEFDHVLLGRYDGASAPDPAEVSGCRWITPGELERELRDDGERYTVWFRIAAPLVLQRLADRGRASRVHRSAAGRRSS